MTTPKSTYDEKIMATGILKMFDPDRGYGFVREDGGGDVFFHITALLGGGTDPDTLTRGARLVFDIGCGRDGRPSAANVRHLRDHEAD